MTHGKRTEQDSMGTMEVPEEALYGASTARAVLNFPISGIRPHPAFVAATVQIKRAAAIVNRASDPADAEKLDAVEQACASLLTELDTSEGMRDFVVDVFQAGAGTSHNMNVNEVIANRAIRILKGERGDRSVVDPNDDVNRGQSTNDVVPTAMRLAALTLIDPLLAACGALATVFEDRGHEFNGIVKSGRTHLQDAVPMRLGQEFAAWARTIRRCSGRIDSTKSELRVIGLGGNAVGTGINTDASFAGRIAEALGALTSQPLMPAADLVEACQNTDVFAVLSSHLRTLALDLGRICSDIRLLASGPNTGIAEIRLPPVQPGSSIMPGKVNPVMAEMLNMVCFQVIGNDTAIAQAVGAGQLELNVMMPLIAHNLNQSLQILASAIDAFTRKCAAGITADESRCKAFLERSLGLATLLNPLIGYLAAASVVHTAQAENRSIREVVLSEGLLTAEQFDEIVRSAVHERQTRS